MGRLRALLAAAAACLLLSACGTGEGGMGLPHQLSGETYPGERMEVIGSLVVASNGCLELSVDGTSHFVIWPSGSQLDEMVRLPGGEVVAEGDRVSGTGAMTPTAPLVANRDGYWANAIGYCAPDAAEVLVLDAARRLPAS